MTLPAIARPDKAEPSENPNAGRTPAPLKLDVLNLMRSRKEDGQCIGDSCPIPTSSKSKVSAAAVAKDGTHAGGDKEKDPLVFTPIYLGDAPRPAKYPQDPQQFVNDLAKERPATQAIPLLKFPPQENPFERKQASIPDHTADFACLKLADWAKDAKAPVGDRDQLAQLIPNGLKDPKFTSEQRLNLAEGLQALATPQVGADGKQRTAVVTPEQEAKILTDALKVDLDKAKIKLNSTPSEIKDSLNGDFQVAAMNRLMELRKNNPALNLDENIGKCLEQVQEKGSSRLAKEAATNAKHEIDSQRKEEQQQKAEEEKKKEKPESKPEPKEQQPKAPEKVLTGFQKDIADSGAYTLNKLADAYNDAGKNGKGVAMMIVGENTPGSKELLERLPQLRRDNPNLNFVVVDKDQVAASTDPAMNGWKKWVDQCQRGCNGEPMNHAFTSVQSIKVDANGVGSPDRVSSTHWGADIAAGLQDQGRYAAAATARNMGRSAEVKPIPQSGPQPQNTDGVDNQVKPVKHETAKPESTEAPPTVQKPRVSDAPAHAPFIGSEQELQKIIADNNAKGLRTIVDFTRTDGGCGPCNAQAPLMDRLASQYPGQVYKVDATNPMTARYANRFPTIVGFGNASFNPTMAGGMHSAQEISGYLGAR